MGITVGDIFNQFPSFKSEDMSKLVGSANYNDRTQISLGRIAAYSGQYAQDLSIFVASKEKDNYTKLLATNQRNDINEQLGISNENQTESANIPLGKSIFDIERLHNQHA